MSDYYGNATLEDWLAEEVFYVYASEIPVSVVDIFESYRNPVESNIEGWMDSDDGYGNSLSWRAWGRGFDAIENENNFDELVVLAKEIMGKTND